ADARARLRAGVGVESRGYVDGEDRSARCIRRFDERGHVTVWRTAGAVTKEAVEDQIRRGERGAIDVRRRLDADRCERAILRQRKRSQSLRCERDGDRGRCYNIKQLSSRDECITASVDQCGGWDFSL